MQGCADLSYYLHSVNGQLSIMHKSQDIEDLLADKAIQQKLKDRLRLVDDIRQFAFEQLSLPESDSYTQYADLKRPYVLKNLFASEEFSTALHRWCYPVIGCAGYRGYFDEVRLQREKDLLIEQGKEVYVANVAAYSTLGWFDDPVLNTFIYRQEHRLVGLIVHELAHQQLYIDDDSEFNESFATAVQQTAVEKWLFERKQFAQLSSYKQNLENRKTVIGLIEDTRSSLQQLYEKEMNQDEKRRQKQHIILKLQLDYEQATSGFKGGDGFKYWFKGDLNNAKLASVSTYHSHVDAFRHLLKYYKNDYSVFYQQVEKLSRMPKKERQLCLHKLEKEKPYRGLAHCI